MTTPSGVGPIVIERRTYRLVAFATAMMMLISGFAAIAPVVDAQSSSPNVAQLNLGQQSDALASFEGAPGNEVARAQSGPSLVSLLVDTLLDLVAVVQADAEADTAPPAQGEGIVGIIYTAADTYGQPREDMLRVASCESNLDPYAVNSSSQASGLFQFMPSTWATTPFADQDIFNAEANANAAAWMWANGRRGEWSCQ